MSGHAAHSHGHDDGEKAEKKSGMKSTMKGLVYGILIFLVAVMAFKWIFFPKTENRHPATEQSQEVSTEKVVADESSDSGYYTLPVLKPIVIQINGNFPSTFTSVPAGYRLLFICTEPYDAQDGSGHIYHAEANKDIDGSVINSDESNKYLNWKCRTSNGKSTTMTINLTPMKLKKGGN